jgi:hypothetical protein
MIRKLLTIGFVVAATALATAQDKKDEKKDEKKATVELFGSLDDRELQKAVPENGIIASQLAWEKLGKAWNIKLPAKVDFDKEFLYVATTVGSKLNISGGKIDDKGDMKVGAISTRDLRDGFRYGIKTFSKEGVKTVNGKELPKE